jgi:hypothetical protein
MLIRIKEYTNTVVDTRSQLRKKEYNKEWEKREGRGRGGKSRQLNGRTTQKLKRRIHKHSLPRTPTHHRN